MVLTIWNRIIILLQQCQSSREILFTQKNTSTVQKSEPTDALHAIW